MAKADYRKFVKNAKKKPPGDLMPGPNAPDPKIKRVVGKKGTKAGAYAIPGFGQVARVKNTRRYKDAHAFNPGRKTGNWS